MPKPITDNEFMYEINKFTNQSEATDFLVRRMRERYEQLIAEEQVARKLAESERDAAKQALEAYLDRPLRAVFVGPPVGKAEHELLAELGERVSSFRVHRALPLARDATWSWEYYGVFVLSDAPDPHTTGRSRSVRGVLANMVEAARGLQGTDE